MAMYASPQYGGHPRDSQQYGGKPHKSLNYSDDSEEAEIPVGLPLDGTTPDYIRAGFVRKVYSILCVQLLATVVIGYAVNSAVQDNRALVSPLRGLALIITMGTLCGISCCCQNAARKFPFNYVMLALVTLGMSMICGIATVAYTGPSAMLAVATTALIFGCLTVYACFTKSDWTGMGPYLFAGLIAMMGFGLMLQLFCWFGPAMCPGPMMHKFYALCGVLLFTGYIIYDTQLILGGSHREHQFTVDDYAFAALNLYIDIINLFLYILQLLGNRSEE